MKTERLQYAPPIICRHHSRTVKMYTMRKIVHLISCCLITLAAVAADSSTSQVFQMRLVLDKPSSETEQMRLVQKGYGTDQKEVLFVQKTALLDQRALKSATVMTRGPYNVPFIEFVFTDDGKKRMAEVTRQSIGKRLAIVIDGQLYSAPKIMTEISSGKAEIAGSFTEQEARELVAKITASINQR